MTPAFKSDLLFKDLGGFPFILTAPLIYDCAVLNRTLTVPIGFPTDLASIPRPLWVILPPVNKYDAAAVVHDWLYQKGICTRHQADRVLNEAMEVLGVVDRERRAIYSGVVVGAWWTWHKYRARELQGV